MKDPEGGSRVFGKEALIAPSLQLEMPDRTLMKAQLKMKERAGNNRTCFLPMPVKGFYKFYKFYKSPLGWRFERKLLTSDIPRGFSVCSLMRNLLILSGYLSWKVNLSLFLLYYPLPHQRNS